MMVSSLRVVVVIVFLLLTLGPALLLSEAGHDGLGLLVVAPTVTAPEGPAPQTAEMPAPQ